MKLTRQHSLFAAASVLTAALTAQSYATPLAITDASFSGSYTAGTPENITGVATMTGLTTSEGTFGSLVGATSNNVFSNNNNSNSSVGYTGPAYSPSTNDDAGRVNVTSGLTANDGVNNLSTGNFQFSVGTFDLTTRFFVIDTTPVASTVGDPMTITLIDSSNNQVGTFTLSVLANQFTNSPGGTTNTALATLTYTQNQNANTAQKLGGVTFSLADLGVTDFSAISTATGIRINGSNMLDPNIVGTFSTVPEPSIYGLMVGALSLGLCLHRRIAVHRHIA